MEDTWFYLLSGRIARPTHHGPVIHVGDGLVGQGADEASTRPVLFLRHLEGLRGVIERPPECERRREGIHLAEDLGLFVPRDAVDPLLLRSAQRLI